MEPKDLAGQGASRLSIYHKLLNTPSVAVLRRKPSLATTAGSVREPAPTAPARAPATNNPGSTSGGQQQRQYPPAHITLPLPPSPTVSKHVSHLQHTGITPLFEQVEHIAKVVQPALPSTITTDDFTRAVAVATVSALRHQGSASRLRTSGVGGEQDDGTGGGHGGHDAPSWSRTVSASVLLACTFLYAMIAEILVDVVDVVLDGSGIDEKFLGVTLFALVPNTTEFMNAMSFAINGNISLRCVDFSRIIGF
jgi:Ca2+:H+ antiporter